MHFCGQKMNLFCGREFRTLEYERFLSAYTCQLSTSAGTNCVPSQTISRWGYSATSGTCSTFTYGGCDGNSNNFATQQDCLDYCQVGGMFQCASIDMKFKLAHMQVVLMAAQCTQSVARPLPVVRRHVRLRTNALPYHLGHSQQPTSTAVLLAVSWP
jgi:hypothetical protein